MMELLIIFLVILILVEFVTIKNLNKYVTELKGLLKARNKGLRNAERKIEERNKLIKDVQAKNEQQNEFIKKMIILVTANKYQNEKAMTDKLKELVSDYQSNN